MSNAAGTVCEVCDINYYYSNGSCRKSEVYRSAYDDRNVFERGYDKVSDKIIDIFNSTSITSITVAALFCFVF